MASVCMYGDHPWIIESTINSRQHGQSSPGRFSTHLSYASERGRSCSISGGSCPASVVDRPAGTTAAAVSLCSHGRTFSVKDGRAAPSPSPPAPAGAPPPAPGAAGAPPVPASVSPVPAAGTEAPASSVRCAIASLFVRLNTTCSNQHRNVIQSQSRSGTAQQLQQQRHTCTQSIEPIEGASRSGSSPLLAPDVWRQPGWEPGWLAGCGWLWLAGWLHLLNRYLSRYLEAMHRR